MCIKASVSVGVGVGVGVGVYAPVAVMLVMVLLTHALSAKNQHCEFTAEWKFKLIVFPTYIYVSCVCVSMRVYKREREGGRNG